MFGRYPSVAAAKLNGVPTEITIVTLETLKASKKPLSIENVSRAFDEYEPEEIEVELEVVRDAIGWPIPPDMVAL